MTRSDRPASPQEPHSDRAARGVEAIGRRGFDRCLEAAACLFCLAASWTFMDYGAGTEFSAGTVTGYLAPLMSTGFVLLAIAVVTVFAMQWLATALVSIAAVCQLPLCFFLLAPGLFRQAAGGVWSAPSPASLAQRLARSLGMTCRERSNSPDGTVLHRVFADVAFDGSNCRRHDTFVRRRALKRRSGRI